MISRYEESHYLFLCESERVLNEKCRKVNEF